jgi:hypothetical protein
VKAHPRLGVGRFVTNLVTNRPLATFYNQHVRVVAVRHYTPYRLTASPAPLEPSMLRPYSPTPSNRRVR